MNEIIENFYFNNPVCDEAISVRPLELINTVANKFNIVKLIQEGSRDDKEILEDLNVSLNLLHTIKRVLTPFNMPVKYFDGIVYLCSGRFQSMKDCIIQKIQFPYFEFNNYIVVIKHDSNDFIFEIYFKGSFETTYKFKDKFNMERKIFDVKEIETSLILSILQKLF